MSTTTKLRVSEWRLMNILYDNRDGLRADKTMDCANADVIAIKGLAQHGLIRGADRAGNEADILATKVANVGSLRVWLTSSGATWVESNPDNRTLRAVDKHSTGRRGARLADVIASADADNYVFARLTEQGLITLHDGAGREQNPAARQFGPVDATWRVRLTQRGRELVGS